MRVRPSKKSELNARAFVLFCGGALLCASYGLGRQIAWNAPAFTPDQFSQIKDAVSDATLASTPNREDQFIAPSSPNPLPQEAWNGLTLRLNQMAARYHGRVAIYLQNLKNGQTWAYHPNDLFPAASLIKVPIMISVFERIHEGDLSLTQTMTLRRHNRVGGSGTLKWKPDGTRLTISQLLDHMIRESDNTAANMLIEAVGGIPYVQSQLPKVGLVYTGIHRQGMSLRSGHVARENYTTAKEMALMLRKIYDGKMIDPASSRLMLDYLLLKKPEASRLGKGLPWGWEIAHKTGLERRACHDAAIILTPHGDFLLTVLTGSNPSYRPAKNFITKIGRLTYRYYGGHITVHSRRYYAVAGKTRRRRSHRRL